MQPNKYQNIVLDDLRMFLAQWLARKDPALAYRAHWDEKGAVRMPQYEGWPGIMKNSPKIAYSSELKSES